MKNIQKSSGFSLIELLIAIAIIGILASIAVGSYSNYVKEAKVSAAQSDLVALTVVIENNYMRTLSYPDAATEVKITNQFPTWSASSDAFDFYITYNGASGYLIKAKAVVAEKTLKDCELSLNNSGVSSYEPECK